jgi:hypothetical protein
MRGRGERRLLPARGASEWLHRYPALNDDKAVAKLVFVLCRIGFWLVVSWGLHKQRWYWRF